MADSDRQDDEPREPEGGASAWGRPVALAASMLVLGFVGGWILRGDDGPVTVVPAATTTTADQGGTTTAGGGDTTPATTEADTTGTDTTADTTATAPDTTTAPAEPPPARDSITLAVLNGTSTSGLAAQNATTAEGLGYTGVETGNAPTQAGPSVVYYRPGEQAAADVVAQDFQVTDVQELPASGPLATAVPSGAQVALVLGPG
ncbi:MAG: LytR C-terminal domain-containing protein [Miltoncostaeaceae bacterium]